MRLLTFILISFSTLAWSQGKLSYLPSFSLSTHNWDWPVEYIKIQEIVYERNQKATFCKRPIEMIDTVVIHHSETPPTETASYINELHLNRGTAKDPWYMIAYSYVINSAYPKATKPDLLVTEGRPLEIVGAHAGTNVFVTMDKTQREIWDNGKIICGIEGQEQNFKIDPTLVQNGKIKANVTTIGVVVVGNYAPYGRDNPNGYSRANPVYPTDQTQDAIARLSCQLQKKFPNIKNIKWHNYYHSTSCPGSIKNYIGQIKTLAEKYTCKFN